MKKKERVLAINQEIRSLYKEAKEKGEPMSDEARAKVNDLKEERDALLAEIDLEKSEGRAAELSSEEQQRAAGDAIAEMAKSGRSQSLAIPEERSAMTYGNVANVAPLTIGEVIYGLNTKTVFDLVGARIQTGLQGDWEWPVVDAIEAAWAGETATLGDTSITIGKVQPTPKRLGINVPISRTAINRGGQRLLDIVKTSIAYGVAKKLNATMFALTQGSNAPAGPFVAASTSKTYAHGGKPSYADIVGLAGAVKSTGIEVDGSAAYVMTPAMAAYLQATPITAGDSRCILEGGKINGVPVFETPGAPEGAILFGYFSYCLCGQFGDMSLGIDPYTGMKANTVNFVLNADWDIKSARNEAFGKLLEAAE